MNKSTEQSDKNTAGRVLSGQVVSDKADKTVVVKVNRFVKHPKYKKYFKKSNRYQAHDETNQYVTGDMVLIQETRPISKTKTFVVSGKVEK